MVNALANCWRVDLRLTLQFQHSRKNTIKMCKADGCYDLDLREFAVYVCESAVIYGVRGVVYYNTLGELRELSH